MTINRFLAVRDSIGRLPIVHATLGFILVGVVVLMPFVQGYTAHTYRLFRGKTADDGYG